MFVSQTRESVALQSGEGWQVSKNAGDRPMRLGFESIGEELSVTRRRTTYRPFLGLPGEEQSRVNVAAKSKSLSVECKPNVSS